MMTNSVLVLSIFVIAVVFICDVKSLQPLDSFQLQAESLRMNKDHSLILVPMVKHRFERSSSTSEEEKQQKKYQRLAHSVHVQSDIRYRYATTLITSRVFNPEDSAREIFLTVILPETAFISRFAIDVGGQLFVAYVKEKEAAWREYQEAISEGKTAGHVGISARHSNQFRVSVNTEPFSAVNFFLVYEELLHRKGGLYEHTINITPRQKIKDFLVEVFIAENRNLTHVEVPNLRRHEISVNLNEEKLEEVSIKRNSPSQATIRFRPDVNKLQQLLQSKYALQFSVIYDVDRLEKGGEVQVRDGYFVHFVAPENLPPMPKHVVFILDTSGSMQGKKLLQTQNAMKTILNEMRPEDHLTIITFSDDVITWSLNGQESTLRATKSNVEEAIRYVESLEAKGGTNINDALLAGLSIIQSSQLEDIKQNMIFFLTDGHPTVGECDKQVILSNVNKASIGSKSPSIFSLAFGRQADFDMLKILSLQHFAFARKIYIAADASLQLEGFYKEVSSPILKDVNFVYPKNEVIGQSLTSTNFFTYYQGSEMVVAGLLTGIQNDAPVLEFEIMATQAQGDYKVDGNYNASQAHYYPQTITETILFDVAPEIGVAKHKNVLERLWAYLTIQDLLKRVARGDLNSCPADHRSSAPNLPQAAARIGPEHPLKVQARTGQENPGKTRKDIDVQKPSDDEDYFYDDVTNGSGDGANHEPENKSQEELEEEEAKPNKKVEDIMEDVGDADLLICDNLERALYLSLKYEFVTPLTSLVVVKPDSKEKGNIGDADDSSSDTLKKISFINSASHVTSSAVSILTFVYFTLLVFAPII